MCQKWRNQRRVRIASVYDGEVENSLYFWNLPACLGYRKNNVEFNSMGLQRGRFEGRNTQNGKTCHERGQNGRERGKRSEPWRTQIANVSSGEVEKGFRTLEPTGLPRIQKNNRCCNSMDFCLQLCQLRESLSTVYPWGCRSFVNTSLHGIKTKEQCSNTRAMYKAPPLPKGNLCIRLRYHVTSLHRCSHHRIQHTTSTEPFCLLGSQTSKCVYVCYVYA